MDKPLLVRCRRFLIVRNITISLGVRISFCPYLVIIYLYISRQKLIKYGKLFSGQSKNNLKTVEFTKSLVSVIISINKRVIVYLFIIILVLTTYLYTDYSNQGVRYLFF